MIKEPKIVYFLKSGRETRITNKSPDEFLYGFNFLRKLNLNVSLIIDTDIGINRKSEYKIVSILNMIVYWLIGIPGRSLYYLFLKRKIFTKYDIVIVTTNSFGLCFSFLKKFGFFKPNVFFITMGLINNKTPFLWILIYKIILKNCMLYTLSYHDAKFLEKKLNINVDYINFGVDKDFWFNKNKNKSKNYVLTIGNDLNRDYSTLLSAWKNDFPLLKIVTNQKIKTHKKNIEIIFGDWHASILSDNEIRQLIINSLFVVLPIKETIQPSGQSVSLQSMSCGKTVLITNFSGLWNRDMMQHNKTCLLAGKPGEVKQLEVSIRSIIANETILNKIGINARVVIENVLNSNEMGRQIYDKINHYAINDYLKKN
jgi:hypothetical protein